MIKFMDERFSQELARFQQTAVQLQEVISAAQRQLPETAHGSDPQGAVEVRVDRNGLPELISASRDWHRRCKPELLGAAVTDAYTAAATELMSAWSQGLASSDWAARVDEVDRTATGRPPGAAPNTVAETLPHKDWQHVVARPLDQVAEDVIASFSQLEALDAGAGHAGQATGRDAGRHVAITLSPGSLSSCEVDAEWAAKQSSIGLNHKLEEALADARYALSRAEAAARGAGSQQQLSSLLDETMAILHDPRRITGS